VSDTPLWLDAFEHDYDVAHERTVRGTLADVVYYPGARRDGGSDGAWLRIVPRDRPPWTGVFASELVAGRLSVVASWPEPHTLMVALGGDPYVVDVRDPDAWGRLDVPGARLFVPLAPGVAGAGARALLLGAQVLAAYDRDGLAWESGPLEPGAQWLGRLDDEVHLRAGDRLHRIDLRHGRTTTEAAPW
jgi:hypothetical protein